LAIASGSQTEYHIQGDANCRDDERQPHGGERIRIRQTQVETPPFGKRLDEHIDERQQQKNSAKCKAMPISSHLTRGFSSVPAGMPLRRRLRSWKRVRPCYFWNRLDRTTEQVYGREQNEENTSSTTASAMAPT
jgi:hypothetical protein